MLKNVIIAEDHLSWRGICVDLVKSSFPDVQVDVVETGSDLVRRVLEGDYSLVISDNDMEEEDAGLKALQTIRGSGNNVPLYMVSSGSSDVVRKALCYGANGFYKKENFNSDKLLEDIAQHLQ
ncbi:TPA: response regulator [Candidatus Woesearchaeota archaeon]|nr:response regulator [Candidatus Woesearchaeota archaeon]